MSDSEKLKLSEGGYVAVPFLSASQVSELTEFYWQSPHQEKDRGFHSTMHQNDFDYRKKVFDKLCATVQQNIEAFFPDYRILIANFLMKDPDAESNVGLHADWSYVDESRFRSVNVWCPLVDTDKSNGRLWVCPETTMLSGSFRGTPFRPYGHEYAARHMNNSVGLDVPKGTAVIYDSAMLHYSGPNYSGEPRLAIAMVLVPEQAQPIHCFTNEGKIRVYDVDTEFFLRHRIGAAPSGYPMRCEVSGNELPVEPGSTTKHATSGT